MMNNQQAELLVQLRRQLQFIKNSCNRFDQGDIAEALRIAVSLRVLFYDKNSSSTSLLTHLGEKDTIHLLSAAKSIGNVDISNFDIGFIIPMNFTSSGIRHTIDPDQAPRFIKIHEWLNEPVFISNGKAFTRIDIIKAGANQDGGAHVDIKLKTETIAVKTPFGTMTRRIGDQILSTENITDHHFPLLRHFADEILASTELLNLLKANATPQQQTNIL